MAVLTGTNYDDFLTGTTQNDTINGLDNDDYLEGADGADTINGGKGQDVLFSSYNPYDPEEYYRTYRWDYDTLADTLDGGAGNDRLVAGFNDTVRGGGDVDTVWLDFSEATSGVVADLTAAFSGGTSTVGKGSLSGLEFYGAIVGSAYSDTIILTGSGFFGDSDQDLQLVKGVYAAIGNDKVTGGSGNEFLYGGAGADTLFGSDGNDLLSSYEDPAWFDDDLYTLNIYPLWDTGTEIDVLDGGKGSDRGFIGLGDSFDGGAAEEIDGDLDDISIWLGAAAKGVTVDLRAAFAGGESHVEGGVIARVERFEAIEGSDYADRIDVGGSTFAKTGDVMAGLFGNGGADQISGGASGDIVFGGSGADRLVGRAGDDLLYAGSPDEGYTEYLTFNGYATYYLNHDTADGDHDALLGGAGNDVLSAGAGDSVDGGSGDDILILDLTAAAGPVTMDLSAAFAGGTSRDGTVSWRGLERYGQIEGSTFADTIILGKARTAGEDYGGGTIHLMGGDDVALGGRDGDTIYGEDGADSLSGMGGDDVLDGGYDADTLNGGDGDDRLDLRPIQRDITSTRVTSQRKSTHQDIIAAKTVDGVVAVVADEGVFAGVRSEQVFETEIAVAVRPAGGVDAGVERHANPVRFAEIKRVAAVAAVGGFVRSAGHEDVIFAAERNSTVDHAAAVVDKISTEVSKYITDNYAAIY